MKMHTYKVSVSASDIKTAEVGGFTELEHIPTKEYLLRQKLTTLQPYQKNKSLIQSRKERNKEISRGLYIVDAEIISVDNSPFLGIQFDVAKSPKDATYILHDQEANHLDSKDKIGTMKNFMVILADIKATGGSYSVRYYFFGLENPYVEAIDFNSAFKAIIRLLNEKTNKVTTDEIIQKVSTWEQIDSFSEMIHVKDSSSSSFTGNSNLMPYLVESETSTRKISKFKSIPASIVEAAIKIFTNPSNNPDKENRTFTIEKDGVSTTVQIEYSEAKEEFQEMVTEKFKDALFLDPEKFNSLNIQEAVEHLKPLIFRYIS
ncbi:hypothetical protein [Phaeocystidibacter marisrubri]|uniref:Uncharacterized protein n=1 Tax=Phaeocystidibacter marisrubri TaxID=1577780 RepID=A0A6L3ZD02_9FLAO|nr:hypothetical protein [Phaeocystidibacter marisrubri]KAB2815516.1 hypothetical protein F8C82_07360 [Phaeocystidibacter marisrubri]GGH64296.1 hypothetical protein GCM10011318_00180 [Phaeocystidibacter marisrubri]